MKATRRAELVFREGEMGQVEPGNSSRMTAVAAGVLSRGENLILSAAETRLRPGAEARIAAGLASFTATVLLVGAGGWAGAHRRGDGGGGFSGAGLRVL